MIGLRRVRVHSSKRDRVQEEAHHAHFWPEVQEDGGITCKQSVVTESGKPSVGVREHKDLKIVPTSPGRSTKTEFDIVTPKQEDIGGQRVEPKGKLTTCQC